MPAEAGGMDYLKKKQLTQSVSFLQANLGLGQDILDSFKLKSVLTDEEISTIQKDDTTSGKVLELVCMLKRKDNRTFSKFLDCLEESGEDLVVRVLQSNGVDVDRMRADPRTSSCIETHLTGFAVPHNTIENLAAVVIPKEIYKDDVDYLRSQITELQKNHGSHFHSARDGLHTPKSTSSNDSNERPLKATFHGKHNGDALQWNVPTNNEEWELLLRQKDEIIKRKDEEYNKLRKVLEDAQRDLQNVMDMNTQYLNIITQLNQMQLGNSTLPLTHPEEKTIEVQELEAKLDESRARVEQLRKEVDGISDELHLREIELEKAMKREKRQKEIIGLPDDADELTVQRKLRLLMEDGKMKKEELQKVQKDLKKAMEHRSVLEDKVSSLTREKDKVEFHMRQQDLAIKKFSRIRSSMDAIKIAQNTISNGNEKIAAQFLKLPSIERTNSQAALTSRSRLPLQQYCMFCRQEFQPLKGMTCRVHFRPIRRGKWSCCEDECHRSAGCLQVPHFYIEITQEHKIFITDGARYLELS